jgi:hypothetical protein
MPLRPEIRMMELTGTVPAQVVEVTAMHASVEEIPVEMKVDGIETRGVQWGDQLVRHVDLPPGVDFTPLFQGLPGNLCQCPHWGIVLSGSINLRFADGTEETTRAGEVFYWPGGHTGWTDEGVVFLEFSVADEIGPVLEHLAAQMATAG